MNEERVSPTPWAAHFHPCQHKHLYAELDREAKPNFKRKKKKKIQISSQIFPLAQEGR